MVHSIRIHFIVHPQLLLVGSMVLINIVKHDTMTQELLVGLVVHELLVGGGVHPLVHGVDNRVIGDPRDPFVIATC